MLFLIALTLSFEGPVLAGAKERAQVEEQKRAEEKREADRRYSDFKGLWGYIPLGAVISNSDVTPYGIFSAITFKSSTGYTLDDPGPIWSVSFVSGISAPNARETLEKTEPLLVKKTGLMTAMFGWQTSIGQTYVAATLGGIGAIEISPEEERTRRRYGPRMQLEIWSTPFPKTLATATTVVETAKGSLWTRGRLGYDVLGIAFIGPEGSVYMEQAYQQFRAGLHITGPRLWMLSYEFSGGIFRDTDKRSGGYGALTLIRKL